MFIIRYNSPVIRVVAKIVYVQVNQGQVYFVLLFV